MGEAILIPARDLAVTYDDVALFRDIERADLHPNMVRAWDAAHDGPLTFSPGGSGSENQKQGHEAAALFSLRTALDRRAGGRTVTIEDVLTAVTPTYNHVGHERLSGQCLKEVLSPSYWHLSAMFRALALRETIGLLAHMKDLLILRQLAAELIVWFRIHRHLIRRFQARDGLVWHPGIRDKSDPDENEQPNVLADCWEKPIAHTRVRSMLGELREGKPKRVARRGHEAMALRIYESPFGRWLESVTRVTTPGRLSTEVGVWWNGKGSFHAIMPKVQAIHTSPIRGGRGNKPTKIIFEVDAREPGQPVLVEFEGHVPVTEWVVHPRGRAIPSGYEVFGPDTPLPEVPEVQVDNVVGLPGPPPTTGKPTPPPRPEEPAPPGQEPDLLAPVRAWAVSPEAPRGRDRFREQLLDRISGIRGVAR